MGKVTVAKRRTVKRIPLTWSTKARSNHAPYIRPTDSRRLRAREGRLYEAVLEAFETIPPQASISAAEGNLSSTDYLALLLEALGPLQAELNATLYEQVAEGAVEGSFLVRDSINQSMRRLGSPVRLGPEEPVQKAKGDDLVPWGISLATFDQTNPGATTWATRQSAQLISNMAREQQQTIQGLISRGFTEQQRFQTGRVVTGRTTQQTARSVLDILEEIRPGSSHANAFAATFGANVNGLFPYYADAVVNRGNKLAAQLSSKGVPPERILERVSADATRYAEKLRRSRARMIARTEVAQALNQGRNEAYQLAVTQGLVNPNNAVKQWVTGPTDVCPICTSLAGSTVPVLEDFPDGDPGFVHPNCRCYSQLVPNIRQSPNAVGGGNPNFPMGTRQNPTTWQFADGFRTAPSPTTTFRPPVQLPRAFQPTKAPLVIDPPPPVLDVGTLPALDETIVLTAENKREAEQMLKELRAVSKANSKREFDLLDNELDRVLGGEGMIAPPQVVRKRIGDQMVLVDKKTNRPVEGEWEWWFELPKQDRELIKTWGGVGRKGQGGLQPDMAASMIQRRVPEADTDSAAFQWFVDIKVRQGLHGNIANGSAWRVADRLTPAFYDDLAETGVGREILTNDKSDEVLQTLLEYARRGERGYEDELGSVLSLASGGSNPWDMTIDEYWQELYDVANKRAAIQPLRVTDEFGAEYLPGDKAIIDRFDELVPKRLVDDQDAAVSTAAGIQNLHLDILEQAAIQGFV